MSTEPIYCYAYVEDEPSSALLRRLVEARNGRAERRLLFREGFPAVQRGYSRIQSMSADLVEMAKAGLHVIVLTDLDTYACAMELINAWFSNLRRWPVRHLTFRVAVREIEAWILADRSEWAEYIGIGEANFASKPDELAAR